MGLRIRILAMVILLIVGIIAGLGLFVANRIKSIRHANEGVVAQLKAQQDEMVAHLNTQIEQDRKNITDLQQIINNLSGQRDNLFISAYQREEVILGPEDTYEVMDHGNFSPSDIVDRVEVNCKMEFTTRTLRLVSP